ncbi:MAG: futalosine hydrolase [Desulfobacteraceae bacterium]|nr:futalosine hydrolase [Desulfobacteraceae bacterium]
MNPDLLILCATDFEISHFLNVCPGNSKILTKTSRTILSGKINHKTYDLLITGPGVFNCAHALTQYLEHSTPGLILQTGIAGTFKDSGLNIGDVAIATQEHYIHAGIQTDSLENAALPFDLIDSISSSRKGIYVFEQNIVNQCYEKLSNRFLTEKVSFSKGPFITVSTITSSFQRANELYATFRPLVEAMEGAASVHIAALYDIPIVEIRSASNFVGQRDKSKWDIDLAIKQLGLVCALI